MAISPTARTLKKLKDSGDYPLVAIVERWNNWAKIRQDLFGIIDLLAIDSKGNTVGIQVTSYTPGPGPQIEDNLRQRDESLRVAILSASVYDEFAIE